jgi:hypothetical protein
VIPNEFQSELLKGEFEDRFQSYIKDRRIGATTGLGMLVAKAVEAGDYPIAVVSFCQEGIDRILDIAYKCLPEGISIDRQRISFATPHRNLSSNLAGRHYKLIVIDEVGDRRSLSAIQSIRADQVVHVFRGYTD